MIALEGVLSTDTVHRRQQYLARIDQRYFVVTPHCKKHERSQIAYKDAFYIDPWTKSVLPFTGLHEVCTIT